MTIRIVSYNASLSRQTSGRLVDDIRRRHPQVVAICRILARLDADIVLINEFDIEPHLANASIAAFRQQLNEHLPPNSAYHHHFSAPVNTGVLSPIDFGQDGQRSLPVDGYGFGRFPGQYGMLLLSRLPIDHHHTRTFQRFRWQDLPGYQMPTIPGTSHAYFAAEDLPLLRLSSKSHWDVPVFISAQRRLHCLCSHPTPPAFHGSERRNYYRNADEIRFWTRYLAGDWEVLDDQGRKAAFSGDYAVVLGDLNNDPEAGDGDSQAIRQLLCHPRLQDPRPASSRFSANKPVTADFSNHRLRVDYVLPDAALHVSHSGVFWPAKTDPNLQLFREHREPVSDHYPVWVDIEDPSR